MQNANMLIDYNLLPYDSYSKEIEIYKLTKELRKHRDKNKFYYIASDIQVTEDKKELWVPLIIDRVKEMIIDGVSCKVIDSNSWDKYVYDVNMAHLKKYITENQKTLLDKLNFMLFKEEYDKYAAGDALQWELDSINFYKSGHPLSSVIPQLPLVITPLDQIEEDAQEGFFFIKGKNIPKMRIYAIAGTVIDKDKVKGVVSIQTPEGIIDVKVYKDLFATMVNVISTVDEQGNKVVLEDSFFEKGTHLLIHGIKRGVTFIPKVYKNTGFKSIMKIKLDEAGNFVQFEQKQNA
jgi:DNA polymerase-3 subunit alpha